MNVRTGFIFALLALFLIGSGPAQFAFADDDNDDEEAASESVAKETHAKDQKGSKSDSKNKKIKIACKPGSKVKVRVDKSSGKVGNVVVICDENGEAVVDIGSKVVAPGAKTGDISTHYETGNVTTVTGKGGKASVNIGSVRVGK